jgi:hypothetical protein
MTHEDRLELAQHRAYELRCYLEKKRPSSDGPSADIIMHVRAMAAIEEVQQFLERFEKHDARKGA